MKFEHERDLAPIYVSFFDPYQGLSNDTIRDMLLALFMLRFTPSNSVCLVKDGAARVISAGQQSRADCVRLATAKDRVRWLRRHANVVRLQPEHLIKQGDMLNWHVRFAEGAMTRLQQLEFASTFGVSTMVDFSSNDWRDARA